MRNCKDKTFIISITELLENNLPSKVNHPYSSGADLTLFYPCKYQATISIIVKSIYNTSQRSNLSFNMYPRTKGGKKDLVTPKSWIRIYGKI